MKTLNDFDDKVIVGSDETLKGDTFGGLIVVGFRANNEERERLRNLGVRDSKTITDNVILRMAEDLKEYFSNNFFILSLMPEEYNAKVGVFGLTNILNELHRKVNIELKTSISIHVVDKYPGCRVGDIIEEKAESKYVEVAAASIIARDEAIKQFEELSRMASFRVPKGSTHVTEALNFLKRKNLKPAKFVKTHFRNVKNALGF
ncbi:MAG: hypothetical protein KKF89_02560 [Nanoarchaeota archaeon]|nr:hypothetical protein [Nanoarchaeota archaeon]MBU1854576.1 hypothetical protein [Nanoarchaeota archaeon]